MKTGDSIRDYVLEKRIGIGGVGEVWRVRHVNLKKTMAIKRILPHLCQDANVYDRFVQEALSMAGLEHPHIVGIHDFFTEDKKPYLVMSYISGGALQDRLDRQEKMPLQDAIRISCEILKALDFAHRCGIVHRDVKPSNILLSPESHAYLVDFGIALVLGQSRITKFGTNIGTPEYMSPEQIRGESLDHQTDVYSFGCVLYEMLAGHPPFGSTRDGDITDFNLMERHIKERPAGLRQRNTEVDRATEAIVMRALAKDKHDRFSGCAEMAAELASLGKGRATPAGMVAGGKRQYLWKVAVGALVLTTAIATFGWFKTSRESASGDLARIKSEYNAVLRQNEKYQEEVHYLEKEIHSLLEKPSPGRTLEEILAGKKK